MKFIAYGLLLLSAALLSESFRISTFDDTTKDDLQKSIDKLKEEAKNAIEKLKAEGKAALATGLEAAEKKLEDLESQLEKLNPQTEIGKTLLAALENLLKKAEENLKAEITKLAGGFYDDAKDDLKKSIDQLKEEAKKAIDKLKAEGKAALATGLEAAEKKLEDIESQLEKLNPQTEVGKAILAGLETLVKKAEENLKAEIKKLSGAAFYDDVKDDLKKSIDQLKEEAKKAIDKLKAEGKAALATGLEAAEKKLEDIESQLEKLNPQTEVGKAILAGLETLVKKAEEQLQAEIKKLSGSFYDVKDDLKKTVDELKEEAKQAIDKLKAEGKAKLAEGLEAVEKRLLDIESQVEKLNPQTEIGKTLLGLLENLLKKAEEQLEAEIKKLAGTFYEDDSTKDDLKKSIDQLKEEAKKAIDKLKAEGKAALATGLEAAEKKLESIESQLEKLNPQTEVGKALLSVLEGLVKKAEEQLKAEIAKLSGSYYDAVEDLKNQLLIDGEKLKKEVQEEIEKLKTAGKAKLAEGLEALEKRLLDIETQVEKLNPQTEIGKALLSVLENLLKKAEENLEAEVKKLSGSY